MIKELFYLTSRRKNSVSFLPDIQQLLDADLSCLLCPEKEQGRASQAWTGVWGSTQSHWTHSQCPESSGHRREDTSAQQHSRCWAVQCLPLLTLSAASETEGPPEQWGVPHIACVAFILSGGWLWVQKNRKIIKFYGQHPAPNRVFLVKPRRAWEK